MQQCCLTRSVAKQAKQPGSHEPLLRLHCKRLPSLRNRGNVWLPTQQKTMTRAVINAINSMAWKHRVSQAACFSPPRNTSNTLINVNDAGPNTASESDIRRPVPARQVACMFRGFGRETPSLPSWTLVFQADKIHISDIRIKPDRPINFD